MLFLVILTPLFFYWWWYLRALLYFLYSVLMRTMFSPVVFFLTTTMFFPVVFLAYENHPLSRWQPFVPDLLERSDGKHLVTRLERNKTNLHFLIIVINHIGYFNLALPYSFPYFLWNSFSFSPRRLGGLSEPQPTLPHVASCGDYNQSRFWWCWWWWLCWSIMIILM